MLKIQKSKTLIFDIECGGVQGLKADRSFMIAFGYKWLGDPKPTVINVLDFPGKHCQDDTALLKEAYKILSEAEALIAHFGEYFDKPFVDTRFLMAGIPPIPPMKLTDTCLIARKRLCLSSNSLANLGRTFNVDTQKMEKGRGWPDWWMGALRGDEASIKKMSVYCGFDVQCLEEIYLKMRSRIPMRDLPINQAIGEKLWTCGGCGGHHKNDRGYSWSEKKQFKRYQCQSCGRWDRSSKPIMSAPIS